MNLNLLAFAIPLFLLLMLTEYLIALKLKKKNIYNLQSSVANISIGIAERMSDVLVTGFFYFVYDYLHRSYAILDIKASIPVWILLLLATDFIWYWYHRLGHEVNIIWAAHVVHHQSEDFNYTASVRITVFQAFIRTGFWCILPIIGFPAPMITGLLLVHGLYPFFTHTQLVGKLGVLEYFMVTPSHHRVHHASNEQYLDKNYGDVFIIWDKLFGTFAKEEKGVSVKYGITQPLKSYSFLWQHFHYFIELWIVARSKKGWKAKLKVIFGKPVDHDENARSTAEKMFHIKQHGDKELNQPLSRYVKWQMALLLLSLFLFILFETYINIYLQIMYVLFLLLTLINCGAIMEQKKWIFPIELARLLLWVIAASFYFTHLSTRVAIALAAAFLTLQFYRVMEKYYLQWVYPARRNNRYE